MRILITTGPTREYIDKVRFISNPSSGKMGFSIAFEAKNRGHEVLVVSGPVDSSVRLKGIKTETVESTKDMIDKVIQKLGEKEYDLLISVAALGDYTIKDRFNGKIKSGQQLDVLMVPTKKLLGEVRKKFPKLQLAGFKAEDSLDETMLVNAAINLIEEYGLDFVVANDISEGVFGSDNTKFLIVEKAGLIDSFSGSKVEGAIKIWDFIDSI